MKKNKIKHTHHHKRNELIDEYEYIVNHRHHPANLVFNIFAKKVADIVGHALAFVIAILTIAVWASAGYYFHFSDTWQLIINTGTTIVTFLIVFLIQNTQNRDTEILNLKIDELIKSTKGASNLILDLQDLSDVELKELEKAYVKIKNQRTGK